MLGKLVEVHLLNGKRFLGRVTTREPDGITLYCIPLDALDTIPHGSDVRQQLKTMLHTLFFPYTNVEYVDIGGEPLGFDHLFVGWFGSESIESFFARDDHVPPAKGETPC